LLHNLEDQPVRIAHELYSHLSREIVPTGDARALVDILKNHFKINLPTTENYLKSQSKKNHERGVTEVIDLRTQLWAASIMLYSVAHPNQAIVVGVGVFHARLMTDILDSFFESRNQ